MIELRIAGPDDLLYIVSLQHKNKESIGFLPRPAIEHRLSLNRIFLGVLNGEPFGYLLFDGYRQVNVLQACIQYDARRRQYGAALYEWALKVWDADRIRLKCAADLEANLFWQSMGLQCVSVTDGGKRRGRKINIWHQYLWPELLDIKTDPAFQLRVDCYDDTGFLKTLPSGFVDHGSLGKLAWSNRKISL